MQFRKALVADPSQEIQEALTEALSPNFQVFCCGSGNEALDLVRSRKPDVLILDLRLPELDGIGVLRQTALMECPPRTLVLTDMDTPFVLGALQELQVSYAMRKPTPAGIIAERAMELLRPSAADPISRATGELLSRLSIPNGSQGYQHLLVALPLLARNQDQSLGKELYPQIAEINRVTYSSVEKAIRDALHAGWERGDRRLWQRYFPGFTQCPQNKPFLFRMSQVLLQQRKCG